MTYFTTNAGPRIYFEHHAGRHATMVLVHGWGMSCQVWDDTVDVLQRAGVGVVTYDQRGCGRSHESSTDMSIETLGADLADLCTHLKLRMPVLNGWSLGAAVAVDAAARLAGRVAGLVLTCGATPRYTRAADFPFGGTEQDLKAMLGALAADRTSVLKGLYQDAVFARNVDESIKRRCFAIALTAMPCADASLAALARLDQRTTLERIIAPALVVIGTADRVVAPDTGRAAARCLPNARSLELDGCGHAPFFETPDVYHGALLDFVSRLSGART
jgi:pimeloyl-[acyl-carrier protein] methyl ester esterase